MIWAYHDTIWEALKPEFENWWEIVTWFGKSWHDIYLTLFKPNFSSEQGFEFFVTLMTFLCVNIAVYDIVFQHTNYIIFVFIFFQFFFYPFSKWWWFSKLQVWLVAWNFETLYDGLKIILLLTSSIQVFISLADFHRSSSMY